MGGTELRAGPGGLRSPNAHHTLCAIPHRFYAIPLGKDFFAKKCARLSWIYREHRAVSMRSWVAMHDHFQDEFLPLCRDARESRVTTAMDIGDDKKSNTQVD